MYTHTPFQLVGLTNKKKSHYEYSLFFHMGYPLLFKLYIIMFHGKTNIWAILLFECWLKCPETGLDDTATVILSNIFGYQFSCIKWKSQFQEYVNSWTMCYCKLHFNEHLFIIVWIHSTRKSTKIGIKKILIKPQYIIHWWILDIFW